MAASQDVKVMSPQETSRWCSSLALCGVRGRILRDLQDQIIRRQIDGLLFDKILRSNGLQDLGIEELNPRLALAIRRSWTTDFSGVSFVDFESSREHQQKQMQQQQQQQQQQVQPPHHMRDSDNIFGGRGATAMGSSNHGVPQRHWNNPASPPNSSSAGRGPPFGTSESWGDRRGSNAQDPASRLGNGTSDGPVHSPQLRRGGYTEPATQPAIDHQIGDSQGYPNQNQHLMSPNHAPPLHVLPGYPGDTDYGADGPVPVRPAEVRRGYPSRYDHRMDDGLPDGPAADSRRGFPQADYRANDLDMGSHGGHPLPGHGQARGFRPEFSDRADRGFRSRLDYTGGDLDMGLDSRGQGSRMAISPSGSPGQPLQMGPPERESADFHSNDHRAMNSRVPAPETGWGPGGASGGCGLGDTFLPRGPAATSYQTANTYESVRRPPGAGAMQEEAWGGSLDDLMPPRQRLPPNVAQTQAEQARRATRAERNRPPGPDDWGGMSLGDALARPRGGRTQTQLDQELEDPRTQEWDRGQERERERQRDRDLDPDPEADPRPSSIRDRLEDGERDFEGEVEVLVPSWPPPSRGGDSAAPMGSGLPRGGRGGGGAGGGVETVPPQSRGRGPGSRAPGPTSDDGWGGQSLGDALAPRRAAAPQGGPGAAGGGTSSSGSRGQRGGRTATPAASPGGPQCDKTPEQIVAWLQSLPESHVPEKARSHIATVVEAEGLGGMQFSQYVQQVPPEVCAPKHAMKLKAAWANVLKEAAAKEVALSNLASQPKQKATMLVV